MKKILLIILCAFVFVACDNVSDGRKAYKEYLRSKLKDPNSLVIYNEKYKQINDSCILWTIDYGYKNSLGGMDRKTSILGTQIDKDEVFDIDNVINEN